MKEIPLNAVVKCSDGRAGTSSHVIFDPTSNQVTHLVVSDDKPVGAHHYLVPVALVAEAGHDVVTLNCTKESLAQLESFVETRYIENPGIETGYPSDSVYLSPYVSPVDLNYLLVEEERIPVGELAIHRGAVVEASDGYVGHLGELLLDPDGAVSHLILQEGHAWGRKEIAVPLTAVDQTLENTIILKLNKEEVSKLPAVPVRREHGRRKDGWATDLLAKLFDNEEGASQALKRVKQMAGQEGASFKIRDAAVVIRDAAGKTRVKETADLESKQGGLFGAVVGGLIGLVAGPAGVVMGALAGAGTGALAAKHVDMGFSNEFLENLEDHLQPGSSALLVLVEHDEEDEVFQSLAASEGVMMRHSLTDSIVEELLTDSTDEPATEEGPDE